MEQPSTPYQTMPASTLPSDSERSWAASAHIGALVLAMLTSWIAGLAGVLAASVVYVIKRPDSEFVADHAREAINFNLSMFLYTCAAVLIGVVLFGATVVTLGIGALVTIPAALLLVLFVAAVALVWLVCSIVAATRAWNGERYRYPLTLRLFR